MKRKISFSVAVAAVLVFVSVTALAVGISGIFGNVNWLGEFISENQSQQPFVMPTPVPQESSVDLSDLEQEIMEGRTDRELVYIEEENGASWTKRTQTLHSMEEFSSLMGTASNLPIPNAIPNGYRFANGNIIYDCRPDGKFELISRETMPEGITVSRYQVDESMDFISGYDLVFTDSSSEDYISIYVRLEELTDVTEHFMGVNPGEQARVPEVPGMDNAIVIQSDTSTYLAMRRVLDEAVYYLEFVSDAQAEIRSFEEVQIDVFTRQLSEDSLIGLFTED